MNKLERFESAVREVIDALGELPLEIAADAEDQLLVVLEIALDRRARKRAERWARMIESTRGLLS